VPQPQNASLVLDARDSHTHWRAVPGAASAVLSGGLAVDTADLHTLTPAQAALFKPGAAPKIRSLSLDQVGARGRLRCASGL
jgi:hypothetical protein